MKKPFFTAVALVALLSISGAFGAEVRFGNIALRPNSQKQVPVLVTGGQLVAGLDFAVQVGDGGIANGGVSTKPIIVGLDTTGPNTVFAASHLGSEPTPNGGLMWIDSLLTDPAVSAQVPAAGILAWITFDTTGTALNDGYSVRLDHVGIADLSTAFVDPSVVTSIVNGSITIKNSDSMTWNYSGDGLWRESRWTGSVQDYPNYITDVVVAAPHTITIDNLSPLAAVEWLQEANSLVLSNGGRVNVNDRVTLSLAAASQIAAGSLLEVEGALDAADLTLAGGTLRLSGDAHANVSQILGSGTIQVGDSATLTATSIQADTLSIGGVYAAVAASNSIQAVPEPTIFALLALGLPIFIFFHRMRNN